MIIDFLLAATLNMSLPEFQPQEDISGNVIVSSIDDETKEIVAEEIPIEDISISDNESVLPYLGLSQEEELKEEIEEESLLRSDGETNYLTLTRKRSTKINNVDGQYFIQQYSSYNYYIDYTLLSSGVTYDLDYNGVIYTGSSVEYDSEVFVYSNNIITPSSDIYIIQYHLNGYYLNVSVSQSGGDNPGGDVSGDDVSGDSPGGDVSGDSPGGNISADLTNVESKLDNVIVLQRSILMTLLVSFLFPIIKSCVNLLKGGKDV